MGISGAVHPSANARITGVKTKYKLEQDPEIGVVSGGTPVIPPGWDLANGTYDTVFLDVSGQSALPRANVVNPVEDKLFVLDETTLNIYQYNLPNVGTLVGASYDTVFLDVSNEVSTPRGMCINSTGTKLFIVDDSANHRIYQYNLPNPGTLVGASYDTVFLDVTAQSTTVTGIFLNAVNNKLFVVDNLADNVLQYNLPNVGTLVGASYDNVFLNVTAQATDPTGIYVKPDDTKLYLGNFTSIYQYGLINPGTLVGASYDTVNLNVGSETSVNDIYFTLNGTKLLVLGTVNKKIYQYTLPEL